MRNITAALEASANIKQDVVSNSTLVVYGQRLAKEDALGLDIVSTFKAVIPAYLGKLVEQANSLSQVITSTKAIKSEDKDLVTTELIQELQDGYLTKEPFFNYTYLSQTLVSVPENFNGSIPEYLDFMFESTNDEKGIYSATFSLLDDYQAMLAEFLTNKDIKTASDVNRKVIDTSLKVIESNTKEYNKFFAQNTGKSKARLSTLFDRLADVKASFKTTSTLVSRYNSTPIEKIKVQVDKCVELLGLVVDRAGDDSIVDVSPAVGRKLADGAMALAQLVEFIGAHRFAHKTLIVSMSDMYKELSYAMR